MYIKVTRIKNNYHARLYNKDGRVLDEMACKEKQDIGYICREMLRWQNKMGNVTPWTDFARSRQKQDYIGKVWKVRV